MKKILLPLLLSSILFADCTPQQEQRANELWKESRAMQGEVKYTQLKKALQTCSMKKIEVDAYLYLISKELKKSLSTSTLDSLDEKLEQVYRTNNNLATNSNETYKETNSHIIDALKQKIVTLRIKVETNEEKLAQLKAFQNPTVEQIKGAKHGETIPITINFRHNNDQVNKSSNINNLAQAINEMLNSNAKAKFTITGYASARGTAQHNQRLSERRANNVQAYIERKYPQTRGHIKTFGKGESDLICNSGFAEDTTGNGEFTCLNGNENESSSRRVEVIKR